MQNHPNDGSNDNPDEFSEFRKDNKKEGPTQQEGPENLREGAARAGNTPENGQDASITPKPNTSAGTPNYGEFGGLSAATTGTDAYSHPAGNNPGGVAAPNVTETDQRGAAPQNRATDTVVENLESNAETRREAYKEDDPRYGSGTRNWDSEEPANRSNGPEEPNNALSQ